MITPKQAIEEVRTLINVPVVKAHVANIYADKVRQAEFDRAVSNNESFIVILYRSNTYRQVQSCDVIVNIYVKDFYGGADLDKLDAIFNAVKPLLENGYTDKCHTRLNGGTTIIEFDSIGYTMYSQDVRLTSVNENLLY